MTPQELHETIYTKKMYYECYSQTFTARITIIAIGLYFISSTQKIKIPSSHFSAIVIAHMVILTLAVSYYHHYSKPVYEMEKNAKPFTAEYITLQGVQPNYTYTILRIPAKRFVYINVLLLISILLTYTYTL